MLAMFVFGMTAESGSQTQETCQHFKMRDGERFCGEAIWRRAAALGGILENMALRGWHGKNIGQGVARGKLVLPTRTSRGRTSGGSCAP